MKSYLQAAVLGLAAIGVMSHSAAAAEQLTVIELFTSQSCYSCPPAEKILGKLAQRDDIIALEHHVDYWDQLINGSDGRWKDIFSSPESTDRQRRYNDSVEGRGYSYTPQMVFNGKAETVGNRKRAVSREISMAQKSQGERLTVAVAPLASGGLTITVDGSIGGKAGIWLLRVLDQQTVRPTAAKTRTRTWSTTTLSAKCGGLATGPVARPLSMWPVTSWKRASVALSWCRPRGRVRLSAPHAAQPCHPDANHQMAGRYLTYLRNSGLRFSRNALPPSFDSSVP